MDFDRAGNFRSLCLSRCRSKPFAVPRDPSPLPPVRSASPSAAGPSISRARKRPLREPARRLRRSRWRLRDAAHAASASPSTCQSAARRWVGRVLTPGHALLRFQFDLTWRRVPAVNEAPMLWMQPYSLRASAKWEAKLRSGQPPARVPCVVWVRLCQSDGTFQRYGIAALQSTYRSSVPG